ncbi:LysR family transcriptional regulator [Acidovorax cavernicola]|uniref:LysR family transcriptional regulator n=1 Tax=Acidovorax cavernicola TaxID=1675792 RepID=A0A9X8D2X8_9BURK|nr:LysR family transcriptional regulator [Acidovorax cavernicola]RIX77555.1 LysR family transcriptional regulator [Acidovorax cavernicola]
MRDLDLTTLRLFVAVCESRSIARAGEQANIVGSAISKRLAQLEDTVGTPLLLRKRRGVVPTPAGETLLEHARAMLGSATRIERDMAAYAGGARGHVRILASASVMAESLAEDVAGFLQDPAHRNIRVDMEERVSPEIVRGIREGVASIGLCWDAADLDGLERRDYRSDHLAIVAHPTHPVARHDAVRFEQVLDHEFVGMPALSAVQLMLAREAAVAGKPLVYRVLVSNFDAALRVVRAGLAISVVPAEVARPFTEAFGLRLMPLTDGWARRRFAICFRGEAALSPSAQLLVAHLERCATDRPEDT